MKKKVFTVLILIMYITAVMIFNLPEWNRMRNQIQVDKKREKFKASKVLEQEVWEEERALLWEAMVEYNSQLYIKGQNFANPQVFQKCPIELGRYGNEENIVAFINIPNINIDLPVYQGATEENLAKGAVYLSETSVPIGGENTNCVIAAHRGYQGIPMFRDITQLQKGDSVYVMNLWETLEYEVSEIAVIEPTEMEEILIQEGRDMLTLFSCHPYTENTYRYVVFCDRKDLDQTDIAQKEVLSQDKQQESVAEISYQKLEWTYNLDNQKLQEERIIKHCGYLLLGGAGIFIFANVLKNSKLQTQEE